MAVWSLAFGSLAIISGALIIFGFLTAFSGVVTCIGGIGVAVLQLNDGNFWTKGSAMPVFVATVAASITLLGPGAISVDSRLFGRREIVIPKRPA